MERDELKGKQTPDTVEAIVLRDGHSNVYLRARTEHTLPLAVLDRWRDEHEPIRVSAHANAALYAEAHNVANRTGLWPEDMVERIKELEYGLTAMSKVARKLAGWSGHDIEELNDQYDGVFDNADRLLYSK